MPRQRKSFARYIGLDVHKYYLVAVGVAPDGEPLFGPVQVPLFRLTEWMKKQLTQEDAVVLEMTTNAFQLHDDLQPFVGAVTLVHPPHVALITRAQVMTDKIAARILARLHAAGLLPPVWVPAPPVRDLRALLAHRTKMVRLATQAKNRLHSTLHRYHLLGPEGDPFASAQRSFWLELPVTPLERVRSQSDLDTLAFAQGQITLLEKTLTAQAAQDQRVPLLVQLSGINLVNALPLLAAIDDIHRFPTARKLVGYAGFGTRLHASGLTYRAGGINKAGRRDLRAVMVEAAQVAVRYDPHWKAELERLEPRLGRNKAIVAIARKLLVAVWHILTKGCANRYIEPERLARKFLQFAYVLGKENRAAGQTSMAYVREQLDRLGVGMELTAIPWGRHKTVPLPPSQLVLKLPVPLTVKEPVSR